MIADVPVGVFLSSGLDSATLASLAAEIKGSSLRTVTLGFEAYRDQADDETPLAEAIARHCGTAHKTSWIDRADFEAESDRLFEAMDQPSVDGVNTYFVSKATHEAGLKVAGEGDIAAVLLIATLGSGSGGKTVFPGVGDLGKQAIGRRARAATPSSEGGVAEPACGA